MIKPFSITIPTNTVTLDDQRRGRAAFNVSNTSGRALKGRVSLGSVPGGAPHAAWLKLIGDPEQQFDIAETSRYEAHIQVPPGAPAGEYCFRLNVQDVTDPDEGYVAGPVVAIAVPQPVQPPKKFPMWIIPVILGALAFVALLAVIVYLLIPKYSLVPAVIGRPAATAQALVEIAGLAVTLAEGESPDPAGIVFASTPEAGVKLKKGSVVQLFMSGGPSVTPTPSSTPTPTSTATASPTATRTPTRTVTLTPTPTQTNTPTRTITLTKVPPSTKFKVVVKTANVTYAGTDANVYIRLFGDVAISEAKQLDNSSNNFEKGDTDTFVIVLKQDIGTLQQIEIWHDNSGPASGWKLSWIIITNLDTNQTWTFSANRWLATDEGDHKIDIVLIPDK